MTPDGSTTVAAVIGSPVVHSLSPAIHNAAFAAGGHNWTYVAFDVAPGAADQALAAMAALGIGGLSVTMPHKAQVAAHVDRLDVAAAALDSVNTVERATDGALVGHSTDGDGLVDAITLDAGVDVRGRDVVVLGAGAAARAVIDALARAGVRAVTISNRSPEAAHRAAALAPSCARVVSMAAGSDLADAIASADVVVNATSVGMGESLHVSTAAMPCDPSWLRVGGLAVDLVYHPLDTAWLHAVRSRGVATLDGFAMLVRQAARQQRIWLGVDPDVGAMRRAGLAELAKRSRA